MTEIVERLRSACNGHPHAKIAWPHRILHEAATRIESDAKRIAELEAERDEWKQAAQVEAGLRREFLTRAESAERALAVAAHYFDHYCQDEADERECCVSDKQHEDAKAFATAIRSGKPKE